MSIFDREGSGRLATEATSPNGTRPGTDPARFACRFNPVDVLALEAPCLRLPGRGIDAQLRRRNVGGPSQSGPIWYLADMDGTVFTEGQSLEEGFVRDGL
jgi:hypothetical protein